MGFQVSPGVQVNEVDLTNVIPTVSTSIAGMVGNFRWGPVEEVTTVISEIDLVDKFGTLKSTGATSTAIADEIAAYFLPAQGFLKYGSNLKIYRATGSGQLNAASGTHDGVLIKNTEAYSAMTSGLTADIYARYPGTLGNSLKVVVLDDDGMNQTAQEGAVVALFNTVHGTDSALADETEVNIAVIDEDGVITGTAGTVLETFERVSLVAGTKALDGSSAFLNDVLYEKSQWIYAGLNATFSSDSTDVFDDSPSQLAAGVKSYSLQGGVDVAIDAADIASAFDTAFGTDNVEVNLLIGAFKSGHTSANAQSVVTVASTRKDCFAFVSPDIADTKNIARATATTNVVQFADGMTTDSYGALDSTALYVYDKYNNKYHYIVAAGHVAGLAANTDDVADPWFSPAGFNRGGLRGVTKLAYNPAKTDRDTLYKSRVNPIVSFPGQGTVLFGDKTLQAKASAFDRINVRRLFITLQKAISISAEAQLFEINDEFTRANFRNAVEPFLREVKGRRGINDFFVVCDETNNTGNIIDTNQFVADIFIKPARSINFITLNFVATRTGVEFNEVIGLNN